MIRSALKFIQYDKAKSIGVTVGIVISAFLIGQQVGIATFLTNLMGAVVDNTRTDIWVVDSKTKDVNALNLIDNRKLREVQSIQGVARAYPVVVTNCIGRFANGATTLITLVGSQAPGYQAGPLGEKIRMGRLTNLSREANVSADFFDAQTMGGSTDVGTSFEINNKRAVIGVQTEGVRGFSGTYVYTTLERARYYDNLSSTDISAVLVDVKPGYDPAAVRDRINAGLYGVKAWLPKDLAWSTINTLLFSTGIGASTGTLILFALLSGFFIIGITMYSAATDRIKDYGTLKAIGARDGYIRKLILTQAAIFALVGFGLAFLFLQGFRNGVRSSGVIFSFSLPVIAGLFLVTLLISLGGAVFALRRINGVEPASVFRG